MKKESKRDRNSKMSYLSLHDWPSCILGEHSKIISGGTPSTKKTSYWNGDIPWITSANILGLNTIWPKKFITKEAINHSATNLIPKDNIIIVSRVGLGKVAINRFDVCISQDSQGVIFDKEIFCLEYLAYYLSVTAQKFVFKNQGTAIKGILKNDISSLVIPLPPMSEQQKIAKILSAWETGIEATKKLCVEKTKQKEWFMQQLLPGKLRFKEFCKIKSKKIELGEFLIPTPRPVLRPNFSYTALGIRSHCKGTFLKTIENPETVMMDTLYAVKEDDLIVNITFAWEGAIAIVNKSDEGTLVSHRFPTYAFNTDIVIPQYFKYVIQTKRFVYEVGLVSPGGAGRNRVLSKTDFLKIAVSIPSVSEQRKIAAVLNGIDREIELLEKKLECLKNQKKGLMQKLLTGQIRVKV